VTNPAVTIAPIHAAQPAAALTEHEWSVIQSRLPHDPKLRELIEEAREIFAEPSVPDIVDVDEELVSEELAGEDGEVDPPIVEREQTLWRIRGAPI